MHISELCKQAHAIAISKGFWGKGWETTYKSKRTTITEYDNCERNNGELIALMHSELSEALEGLRHNDWKNVAEEMADCVLRIADFCEARNIDLEKSIIEKMKKNQKRPLLHGKKF